MSETYESIWSHLAGVAFRQDWLTVNGLKTRYVRAGSPDAPKLIMLHGIGGSLEAFCANLEAHAQHFDVVAFDMIGAGYTDKPDQGLYGITDYAKHTAALMDALGFERASFIGVSLGSWIAARFTVQNPSRTDKMVCAAISGLTRQTAAATATGAGIRADRMAAINDPSWDRVANIFVDLIKNPAKRLPDLVKLRQSIYRSPGAKAAMERILAVTDDENFAKNALSDDEWRGITVPTLIISATDDSPHFQRNATRAASLLPNSELAEMARVGHWAQFEDPETFNRLSLGFLLGEA